MYEGFEEETGRVLLKMRGACSGCPSSAVRSIWQSCGQGGVPILATQLLERAVAAGCWTLMTLARGCVLQVTLKSGIEGMLKHYIPEVRCMLWLRMLKIMCCFAVAASAGVQAR